FRLTGLAAGPRIREAFSEEEAAGQGLTDSEENQLSHFFEKENQSPQVKVCTMKSGLTCQHSYAGSHGLDDNSWTWNMLEVQRTKAQILSHSHVLAEKDRSGKRLCLQ
ncbi:hypothetical protein LEMLEM_LOCUS26196, partial [Lemmus lemmus]